MDEKRDRVSGTGGVTLVGPRATQREGTRQPRRVVHAKHDEHSHTLPNISKSKTKTVGAY